MVVCHVVDLELSLLLWLAKLAGAREQALCVWSVSRMMLNYDHFTVFTLGKYTYEIPAKYGYKRHFVNFYLCEFILNIFREKVRNYNINL